MSNLPIYEALAHAFRSGAIFGRTDFASIARGFGLKGATVADLGELEGLMRGYEAGGGPAEIWNIPISDRVTSPACAAKPPAATA